MEGKAVIGRSHDREREIEDKEMVRKIFLPVVATVVVTMSGAGVI